MLPHQHPVVINNNSRSVDGVEIHVSKIRTLSAPLALYRSAVSPLQTEYNYNNKTAHQSG